MKLFTYLAQHKGAVLLVIMLLAGQAFCDLMLPNYTSQIVDVGIQQAGVEHVATEELSSSTYESIEQTLLQGEAYNRSVFHDSYYFDEESGTYKLTDYGQAHRSELDILMAAPLVEAHNMADVRNDTSLIDQMGIAAARAEYKDLNYDITALQFKYLIVTGLKMLGFVALSMLLAGLVGLISARTGAQIGRSLRSNLFKKVVAFNEPEIEHFSTASLITRGTNDIQQIQMMSIMMMRMVLYAPILAVGGIIMVARTNASMSWLIGVAILVIFAVIFVLMLMTMPKFRIMQKLIDRLNLISREMITGVSVIRAFGQQQREQIRFDDASTDLMKTQLFTNRAMTMLMPAMFLVMNLLSVAIIWFGANDVDAGIIQTGDLIAFITYAMIVVSGFLVLSMLAILLPRADVSARRIQEVLDYPISITDPIDRLDYPSEETPLSGSVEFDQVSFCYEDGCKCALHDVSFTIKPGEVCAIIGSTGSGKSTLCKLIERFYDPQKGTVKVGGYDIRQLPLARLRRSIGYVPQRSFLFSGTIASNVGFAEDDADVSRIMQSIQIAQATELLQKNDEGIDMPITQGGTNVSGGQRQRLAIARALATKAPILLFDDSFSALDYKTDAKLRHALAQELPGRTQIIIAQRIATVMNADHIIVLDNGRIAGQGTHDELLISCEQYREIAESQLSPEELQREIVSSSSFLEEGGERQ